MGTLTYNATEELLPHRTLGQLVVLEIGVQEAIKSRTVEKRPQKALGGAMEVIKYRGECEWSITFEPVSGAMLDLMREFMASTEGGEPFTIDIYGTASAPKRVKRTDEGYSESPFMRRGGESVDMFEMQIQVVEL
jgi:hypothetical protein